jgi:uncharacterized protein
MQNTLSQAQTDTFRAFLNRVFSWMFAGLLLTAVVSWFTQGNTELLRFTARNFMLLIFAELGLVFALSWLIGRISGVVAGVMFVVYAVMNGLTLTPILLAYTESSVVTAFVSAAAMFGVMALVGYTTKADLTRFGTLLFMGLIGVIVAGVTNIFLNSGPFGFAISAVSVVIFCGLTAYDMQKLKNIALYGPNRQGWGEAGIQTDAGEKHAIMGALALYLDFINIFLQLLRLFGRRR